jgi:hypothetical protein
MCIYKLIMSNRFVITESERSDILNQYGLSEKRPLEKLLECRISKDGKYITFQDETYYTSTGNIVPLSESIVITEDWSLSDILHAGADVVSAGLDFVIPGSGAVVDVLNGLSYIIEAQFKSEEEKDGLYLMAAVTFAFVVMPGPLQAVAIPLKRFLSGGVRIASKGVLSALKVVGKVLNTVLLGIPSLIKKALGTRLGRGILGKWGSDITKFFNNFKSRITRIFNNLPGASTTATTKTLTKAERLAAKFYKLTPKLVTRLTKAGQKIGLKLGGSDAAKALSRLGLKQGKLYRYLGKNGKVNTVFVKEIKPDGTVIGLFGNIGKSGKVLGTQAAVPAGTFVSRAVIGPWTRRGAGVTVPFFVKRLADSLNDNGEIDMSVLDGLGDLDAAAVSAASLAYLNEDIATYQGDTKQYSVIGDVTSVQKGLELINYKLPKFGADGKFGPETQQQLKKFQSDNSIESSGKMDGKTVEKLIEVLNTKKPQGFEQIIQSLRKSLDTLKSSLEKTSSTESQIG